LVKKAKNDKNKTVKKVKKNTKEDKLKAKIDKLSLDLENSKSELENIKDKNIRLLAEFDNYKRRSIDERKKITKYAAESFIKDLLPIIDDFARTIESIEEKSPLNDGILMVKSKLDKAFNENGITVLDSVGEVFDPDLHEALMNQESEDHDEGTIISEFEKGYKYHDRIIRHAKVVVCKTT
jgi:molecular chaperone GrpE